MQANTELEMIVSSAKRKRAVPAPDFDEGWDAESLQVESVPSRKKKTRFHLMPIADNTSDFAASTAPSLADTNSATATIADTESPLTEVSSARSKTRSRPKNYHCPFLDCNKAFDRPIRLQTHINSHTGERPHQCTQSDCDKSFYKPEHLKRHLKEKHGDASFVCIFEVRNEETGIIGPCERVFESATKLKRHVAVHEDKEETTCSWESCGKVFRKQETLQRHIKKDHLKEDSYMCMRVNAEGGACGQSFPTPGQLKGHEAREHDAPKYVCEICTNSMPMNSEEAVPDLGFGELDAAFLPTPDDLQGTAEDVNTKILSTLSLNDITPQAIEYAGGIVGFPTYHELQRHNKLVHPPTCPECGKRCKSNKDLSAHKDIEHSPTGESAGLQPEKKYLCPYEGCPRSVTSHGFSKKGNMDVHIKSAHTKAKDFVCGTFDLTGNQKVDGWNRQGCGIAFVTKQTLIGHIRTQHLGIPAAIGVRTGLREKDKKRMTRMKQRPKDPHTDDTMAIDDLSDTSPPHHALSMLTGAGYELRPYACFLANQPQRCQMRFKTHYELGMHMELTHGYNVDDINDTLLSYREHTGPGAENDPAEDMLRQRLQTEMDGMEKIDPQLHGVSA